ncbi:hypothetical protein M0R45_029438 [Rubus argutus]|uniref:Uncharacterized protein n=1 Tax=Rubus argutus TaxID=59490 RepID=A0AAW1W7P5_RUBAR
MLCWLCDDDFTFVLDPFSPSGDNIAKCRFIKEPDYLRHDCPDVGYSGGKWLGVCGGRLQMCIATSGCSRSIHPDPVRIWELKEEVVLNHDNTIGKFQWLGEFVKCKLSGGSLDEVAKTSKNDIARLSIYPFVLPGWPTPVPKQQPICLPIA